MNNYIYVLDANVFIEASRRYYAFDIVPVFWNTLIRFSADRRISSIDRVQHELGRGNDTLANWSEQEFNNAFLSTDEESIIESYETIINWVQDQQQFTDAAKEQFATVSDGWLIAFAMVNRNTIVTHEVLDTNIQRKVPIPNICRAFNMRFIDTFQMLRELGVQFR